MFLKPRTRTVGRRVIQPSFVRIVRLADVLPLKDGSGAATVGTTKKHLESLGCPTWESFADKDVVSLSANDSQLGGPKPSQVGHPNEIIELQNQ